MAVNLPDVRKQYIPKGAMKICRKGVAAEVYVFNDSDGRPSAMAFKGRAQKPTFYHFYKDAAGREKRVTDWLDALAKAEQVKAERRAARNAPHTLEVGTVLMSSWGYDQTNVDWFKVIGTSGRNTVELVAVEGQRANDAPDGYSSMSTRVVPDPDHIKGKPAKYRVDMASGVPSVKIQSFAWAYVWDGKPKYSSWYA